MFEMETGFLVVLVALADCVWGKLEPWAYQLEEFKNSTYGPVGILTLPNGVPVTYDEAYVTLNKPIIYNRQFLESVAHMDQEKVPERVVHSKGIASIGYLRITHDVTDITNAALFSEIGKVTPLVVRFSQGFSERGSADTIRGFLGFAAKLYTEEGNWDFTALSTDAFFLKDPIFFPSAVHSGNRNPKTNILDNNPFLDFFFSRPESMNFLLQFFGDPGIYESFRYAPGFAFHAFQVENDRQEISFARFSVHPDAGVKYMNQSRATQLAGSTPDYYLADLYNAIATGNYPTWTFAMQVIPLYKVKSAPFDIFDVTFRWPLDLYPLKPIGKIVLTQNPDNQFKYQEQIALDPTNLVPGIQGVDKMFEGRSVSYRGTQRYRVGVNVDNVEVNRPRCPTYTYNRDGYPPVLNNGGSGPNYYPNSFNGPVPVNQTRQRTKRVNVYTDPRPTNLWQAREYYNGLTKDHQQRIIDTIVGFLSQTVRIIQQKAIQTLAMVSGELANAVQVGLAATAK